MYYPIQRYKFESNSQPAVCTETSKSCCIIRYKDTNLKAIHNDRLSRSIADMLYYPIQRYKFESNSQRILPIFVLCRCCIIRYKDTNLKAIHNVTSSPSICARLYYPIQRYKFESNSQRVVTRFGFQISCIIRYKDTNLKAIHNVASPTNLRHYVVLSDTKIQIWKQFTTWVNWYLLPRELYYPIQRYKFESNSQQFPSFSILSYVVLSDTKIQIWKQFTTLFRCPRS